MARLACSDALLLHGPLPRKRDEVLPELNVFLLDRLRNLLERRGHRPDEIEGFRRSFEHRRQIVVEGLNSIKGITCRMPGGAFYAFPNIKGTGRQSAELARALLEEAHVALIHGESFGANSRRRWTS
jgi:aspartate/methionine/tyrosine aminotransferase